MVVIQLILSFPLFLPSVLNMGDRGIFGFQEMADISEVVSEWFCLMIGDPKVGVYDRLS